MPRKPTSPTTTARCEHADLDPRVVIVDTAFSAKLTTKHTRRFVVTPGPADEISRDIPNLLDLDLAHLDEHGVAQVGSAVKPGTILVGKVTPRTGAPLSPEEKLLHAIFGEKAGDLIDRSLRAPPRCFGEVVAAGLDGSSAEVNVAWDRPLEVGDVLSVDGERLIVAEIRPLSADLARRGGEGEVAVTKVARARDEMIARSIGPYDPLLDQPIVDADGLAGQVVSADAIAALASAAPWAAWELLTSKSDSVTGRLRLYERLVKNERPDMTPRDAPPPPVHAKGSVPLATQSPETTAPGSMRDIFSFFAKDPPRDPDHVAALQPEVVTQIVLHLRALGLEVDLRQPSVGVSLLTSGEIRETSWGEVRERGDLASQPLFGPIKDYACACGKYQRMRHRGVVCEECGVEVIQSRVRRTRCGHLELAADCVHPLLPDAYPLTTLVVLPPELRGPELDAAYAQVLAADADSVQAAVDRLFAALSGRIDKVFHPRMYTKPVDFSGAAHLVIDESLSPGECRVPRDMLLELFRPHAYAQLELRGYTLTLTSARRMVDDHQTEALAAIATASEGSPVLLIAGATVVARRVTAWDAPAIGVDAPTADLFKKHRTVALHVPLTHEAALTVAELAVDPHVPSDRYDGWLSQARRDGRLVDAAVHAALSGERDPVDDPVVHLALGRAPAPIDESALERWQTAEQARLQAGTDRFTPPVTVTDEPPMDHRARLVDELELSVRTSMGLSNLEIKTVGELCERSEADLKRGGIGPKSMRELKEVLETFGLALADA